MIPIINLLYLFKEEKESIKRTDIGMLIIPQEERKTTNLSLKLSNKIFFLQIVDILLDLVKNA